jgi:hypothetical protein
MIPCHRRSFLAWSIGLPLAGLQPEEELVPFEDYGPGFSVEAQAANPRVKCFDLRRLTSPATPAGEFFAFHQTQTPQADAGGWRLRIVQRPVELSLADLRNRPDRRHAAVVIECSGNSGDPRLMNGLVSNAVWTGVSPWRPS